MINYSDLIILALIDRYDQKKWYHSNILQFKMLNRLVCSKMQKINRQTIKLKIKLRMKTANIRYQTGNIPLFASY